MPSDPPHPFFKARLAGLHVTALPGPVRLRLVLLVFGVVLGLSGFWMLLPELLRPKSIGLTFDRAGAEMAAAHRAGGVLAAEIGAIRGDLWAEAAFTNAPMAADRSKSLERTHSDQLARAKAEAETALALAPVNGAVWLFLAKLPAASPEGENRVLTLLEMSYFTAPSSLDLAPWRLERAATSSAFADKDFQAFIKSDIRGILDRGPEYRQAILAAYRNAWPQNQPIFESLVAAVDPAMAQLLRSGQPK